MTDSFEWFDCPNCGGKIIKDYQVQGDFDLEVYCHRCRGKYRIVKIDGELQKPIEVRQPKRQNPHYPTKYK